MCTDMVTCICPTFARVSLLEEAIESFLRQDHAEQMEMLIVNDCSEQVLYFNHPRVRIINLAERFKTLGEKQAYMVSEAKGNILVCWDDDDIALPHKVSRAVTHMRMTGKDAVIEGPHYFCDFYGDSLIYNTNSSLAGQSTFRRQIYELVGGYNAINCGSDDDLNSRFRGLGHLDVLPEPSAYVYRWGTNTYKLSGHGPDRPGEHWSESGYHKSYKECQERFSQGCEPKGFIELRPHWKWDYIERCAKSRAKAQEVAACGTGEKN